MTARLTLHPITQRAAIAFVRDHHRHSRPPVGAIFCVAVAFRGEIVGVATAGRPVARHLDDGLTLEVTRCCVLEGYKNACSMLYGACWRAARALGWTHIITYTLQEERGASLRGAGWGGDGAAGGGQWNCPTRPRSPSNNAGPKVRYSKGTRTKDRARIRYQGQPHADRQLDILNPQTSQQKTND